MADFLTDALNRVVDLEAEIKEVNHTHVQQLSLLRGEIKQLEHKLATLTQCHIIATNPIAGRLKRLRADLHQEVNYLERQRYREEQANQ